MSTQEAAELFSRLHLHTHRQSIKKEPFVEWLGAFSEASISTLPGHVVFVAEMLQDLDLFCTASGSIGVASEDIIKIDDSLLLVAGAPYPFCARKTSLSSGEDAISLRTPCIVDVHYPNNRIYPMEKIPLEDFHVSLMDGGLVISEAIKKFGDANRYGDVFEETLLS